MQSSAGDEKVRYDQGAVTVMGELSTSSSMVAEGEVPW